MNKTKKILVILLLSLLISLQMFSVKAADWSPEQLSLGETVNGSYWASGEGLNGQITLNGNTYDKDIGDGENIFCVEHGKHLPSSFNATVKYIVHVEKDGVRLEVQDGDEKSWNYNELTPKEQVAIFRMMYILHQGGTSTNQLDNKEYSDKQKAVWENAGDFFSAVGVDISTASGGYTSAWTQKAQDYVDSMQNRVNSIFQRNKNKEDVSVEMYDDGKYVKVGPFNYSYSGNITDLYLEDGNGNRIDSLYAKYLGNDLETSEVADGFVESNSDFYMLFDTSKQVDKIGKLHISTSSSSDIITGKVYVLETTAENQNLISTVTDTTKDNNQDELQLDLDLLGNLHIIKTDSQNTNKRLSNVEIKVKRNSDGKYVITNGQGGIDYTNGNEIPEGWTNTFTTDENGEIWIYGVQPETYTITEIKNNNSAYETYPDITTEATVSKAQTEEITITNQRLVNLEIIKRDEDTGKTLPNVKLKIRREADNKYIKIDSDGKVLYVDNEAEATEFFTDENGKVTVNGVTAGNYIATEIENPNKGYEKNPNKEFVIPAYGDESDTRETVTFYMDNKRKYVDLSGYVWEDMQPGKQSLRNDLYKGEYPNNEAEDTEDIAVNGMLVALKEIQYNANGTPMYDNDGRMIGTEIAHTTTAEIGHYDEIDGGEYLFEEVEIEKLKDYYVEFEYDGLVYQSVVKNLSKNNGSKAVDTQERTVLDNKFDSINSTGENKVTFNHDQNTITYTETTDNKATVKDSSECTLHANTKDANYTIEYKAEDYKNGISEIKYINLGIYKKAQADMALVQDIENVTVGVNGYWHIYKYHTVFDAGENSSEYKDRLNVGVKFKNIYDNTYTRAIYKSDLAYTSEEKDKELQVYLTYKVGIVNESTYITRVNSIVNYYDNRYEVSAVGTGMDTENNSAVTGKIDNYKTDTYTNALNKVVVPTNTTVQPGETNYIYIQFKLNREAVLSIMNDKETLTNTSEINSYTVYKSNNGETVAAVDHDSVPGNTVIGKSNTYEDDTDSRPAVKLELKGERGITGIVFEDATSGELKTGSERLGDGTYKNSEDKAIAGVKVTLHKVKDGKVEEKVAQVFDADKNEWVDAETTTNDKGEFKLLGYIPGQYVVMYTWGDKTYTVQNYKGTIYDSSRNQSNMEWYKENVDVRKTDALDNYDERLAIDAEIAKITNHTVQEEIDKAYEGKSDLITITSMDSTTPTMEFGVEYETTMTDGSDDKVEFLVKNVDFGIVKRPIQKLDMRKRVTAFKVTLANGQTLVDATLDEDSNGNITVNGSKNHLTYMKPTADSKGYVKLEVDNELIEGATMEATYTIESINKSEVDYDSEEYYKYGIKKGNIITLTPSAVVDYLDKKLGFDANKNSDWKQISVDELNNLKAIKMNDTDYLNSKMILYTDKTTKALKPNEKSNVDLSVSKILTSSEDLTFDNDAEVTTITPGNPDEPNKPNPPVDYPDVEEAEPIIIVPSTGGNKGYAAPIITVITSLVILGVGIFIIKKKIIDNK